MTAKDLVARGVARLDEVRPGWHAKVDLDTLILSSPDKCVCGQVFGSFLAGKNALGISLGTDYGFATPRVETGLTYAHIQREWERVISERQAFDAEANAAIAGAQEGVGTEELVPA